MKKLYVGNLPYDYDNHKLEELFSPFGNVSSASIIIDRTTGQSKGFGFVELDDGAASKAITALNNKEINSRNITVNEARPMEDRGSRGGFGNRNFRR